VHQLLHVSFDGVTYFCAPSAGGHLRASEKYQDGWFFGYTVSHRRGQRRHVSKSKELSGRMAARRASCGLGTACSVTVLTCFRVQSSIVDSVNYLLNWTACRSSGRNRFNWCAASIAFTPAASACCAKGLLDTPFSLTQARVLFEIAHQPGTRSANLASELGLDPAYLSRLLASFERRKLVVRSQSRDDRRVNHLRLDRQRPQPRSHASMHSRAPNRANCWRA
jgi:hypothetical protein